VKAEQLTAPLCGHGEGAAWSPTWAGPRWVDMLAGDVLELQPDGSVRRRHTGKVAALTRAREGGGWLVAGERALVATRDDDLDAELERGPELWADPDVRSNEGTCAPDGSLLLGTVAYDAHDSGGSLLHLEAGRRGTRVCDATISNGLGFTAEGTTAFYIDSTTHRIDRFDWDPVNGLTARRPWVDVGDVPGMADGLAVAADGGVWVAFFGGGCVRRYGPDGELDAVVDLPVAQPTSVAFVGGGELSGSLIVTTSRHALGDAAEPSAGALYSVAGVGPGVPLVAWRGESPG
jgi:sugar lactone lactonase YvrE